MLRRYLIIVLVAMAGLPEPASSDTIAGLLKDCSKPPYTIAAITNHSNPEEIEKQFRLALGADIPMLSFQRDGAERVKRTSVVFLVMVRPTGDSEELSEEMRQRCPAPLDRCDGVYAYAQLVGKRYPLNLRNNNWDIMLVAREGELDEAFAELAKHKLDELPKRGGEVFRNDIRTLMVVSTEPKNELEGWATGLRSGETAYRPQYRDIIGLNGSTGSTVALLLDRSRLLPDSEPLGVPVLSEQQKALLSNDLREWLLSPSSRTQCWLGSYDLPASDAGYERSAFAIIAPCKRLLTYLLKTQTKLPGKSTRRLGLNDLSMFSRLELVTRVIGDGVSLAMETALTDQAMSMLAAIPNVPPVVLRQDRKPLVFSGTQEETLDDVLTVALPKDERPDPTRAEVIMTISVTDRETTTQFGTPHAVNPGNGAPAPDSTQGRPSAPDPRNYVTKRFRNGEDNPAYQKKLEVYAAELKVYEASVNRDAQAEANAQNREITWEYDASRVESAKLTMGLSIYGFTEAPDQLSLVCAYPPRTENVRQETALPPRYGTTIGEGSALPLPDPDKPLAEISDGPVVSKIGKLCSEITSWLAWGAVFGKDVGFSGAAVVKPPEMSAPTKPVVKTAPKPQPKKPAAKVVKPAPRSTKTAPKKKGH